METLERAKNVFVAAPFANASFFLSTDRSDIHSKEGNEQGMGTASLGVAILNINVYKHFSID